MMWVHAQVFLVGVHNKKCLGIANVGLCEKEWGVGWWASEEFSFGEWQKLDDILKVSLPVE